MIRVGVVGVRPTDGKPIIPEDLLDINRCDALVDTGAQISLVSPKVISDVMAIPIGVGAYTAANGQTQEADEYLLGIDIPIQLGDDESTYARGMTLRVLEVPALHQEGYEVILGMDCLGLFHITMWNNTFVLSN